jgi:hypothetical protein
LEATALIAICYLRKSDFPKAQPYITEVLQNKKVIKTDSTRNKFHKEIIHRFDEEAVMMTLKSSKRNEELDENEIHKQAIVLEQTKDSQEIYAMIGNALPRSSREILFMVDEFSKKQLTFEERKLLPSSEQIIQNDEVGKTVFTSFKRVLYNSICNPDSEVYKAWYTNGIGAFCDKKLITASVVGSLFGLGVTNIIIVIATVALLLRFGLDIYCERYRPEGIMEIRGKKK